MCKKIAIRNCGECPHKGCRNVASCDGEVPVCKAMSRDLPYTVTKIGRRSYALTTPDIPRWCQLVNN